MTAKAIQKANVKFTCDLGEGMKEYQRADDKWMVAMGSGAWASVADRKQQTELEKIAREKEKGGQVVVHAENGNVVVQTKNEIEFKRIAQEIVEDTLKVGEKYLRLCLFIRQHQITPKDSTKWLLDLGFHKAKASEINRVAQTSNELFEKYQARLIGWRDALQLSRGGIEEMKRAKVATEEPGIIEALKEAEAELVRDEEREQAAAASGTEKTDEEKKAAKRAERVKAWHRGAVTVLQKSEFIEADNFEWNIGNGYKLILKKTKKDKKLAEEFAKKSAE